MDKVASFEVDHLHLKPGVYLSRKDSVGDSVVTTLDVRLTAPYQEDPLTAEVMHTLEHLGAVYLRGQSSLATRILYWGPMGCQTGFDLLVAGEVKLEEAVPELRKMCLFIANFEGQIPGAAFAWQCGNYTLHDLNGARAAAKHFAQVLSDWKKENSIYPRRTN